MEVTVTMTVPMGKREKTKIGGDPHRFQNICLEKSMQVWRIGKP
jgi:hypothetical protein